MHNITPFPLVLQLHLTVSGNSILHLIIKSSDHRNFIQNGKTSVSPANGQCRDFSVEKGVRAAYQTRFKVPEDWTGKRIILRFDGVYSDAIVWINGKKAASHTGGFNVFESDITPLIRKGLNTLSVGVMNESIADTLSCGSQYAAHPLGGIPRKVTLFPLPEFHISDVFIQTDLDDNFLNAKLKLDLTFRNTKKGLTNGKLQDRSLCP